MTIGVIEATMVWTAWQNGAGSSSGAGYGFKIALSDRARFFDRHESTVVVELPASPEDLVADVSIGKRSFWSPACGELISREIGRWLHDCGYVPWPKGKPPKFIVRAVQPGRYRVLGPVVQSNSG